MLKNLPDEPFLQLIKPPHQDLVRRRLPGEALEDMMTWPDVASSGQRPTLQTGWIVKI